MCIHFLAFILLFLLFLVAVCNLDHIHRWTVSLCKAYQAGKKEREKKERRCLEKVDEWKLKYMTGTETLKRLVQSQIYLLDGIDQLQEQEAQSLSPQDVTVCSDDCDRNDEKVKSLQCELETTIQEIWLHKQDIGRLVEELDDIPEARKFWLNSFSDKPGHSASRILCGSKGGCCGRPCRCCDRPRRTAN